MLAAIVGIAAGHLVAALIDPASSPVLAIGSTVIDLTPTPVKEWAVAQFGTADKPILVGSVLAGAILLAAIGGVLARRRFALGAGCSWPWSWSPGSPPCCGPRPVRWTPCPPSPRPSPASARCGGSRAAPPPPPTTAPRPTARRAAAASWSPPVPSP